MLEAGASSYRPSAMMLEDEAHQLREQVPLPLRALTVATAARRLQELVGAEHQLFPAEGALAKRLQALGVAGLYSGFDCPPQQLGGDRTVVVMR